MARSQTRRPPRADRNAPRLRREALAPSVPTVSKDQQPATPSPAEPAESAADEVIRKMVEAAYT